MSDIRLSPSGPPETILPPEPQELLDAIAAALGTPADRRREAVAAVVTSAPRSSSAWAAYAEVARDALERYAAYRVGYHRGLDALRGNGWRGSGHVRWVHPSNRGVLRCFAGLAHAAAEIGETDEVERMETFLRMLDPDWTGEVL